MIQSNGGLDGGAGPVDSAVPCRRQGVPRASPRRGGIEPTTGREAITLRVEGMLFDHEPRPDLPQDAGRGMINRVAHGQTPRDSDQARRSPWSSVVNGSYFAFSRAAFLITI
jgi:hypothetical protein